MSLDPSDQKRAEALLDQATSAGRGLRTRLGKQLDTDPRLRRAVLVVAEGRGVRLPEEAHGWPGKRLLRRAMGKEREARVRRNPVPIDEAFRCGHCDFEVPAHGRTARDHCPRCLRSLHVDAVTPGDREADCGGLMDPVGFVLRGSDPVILHRCRRCGVERRVRAVEDGAEPDDAAMLRRLSSGETV